MIRNMAVLLAAATIALTGLSGAVNAGTDDGYGGAYQDESGAKISSRDFNQIKGELMSQGYYDIEVVDPSPPFYQVEACRDDRLIAMTVDRFGNIKQREDVARCAGSDMADAPPASGGVDSDQVNVDAPGTKVAAGENGTHVKTPLADVNVGKDGGVHIKVPFFELNIP